MVASGFDAPAMAQISPKPVYVKIVSQDGVVLDGSVFSGTSCTKSEDGTNWDCLNLSDYPEASRAMEGGVSNEFINNEIQLMAGEDTQRFTINQSKTVPNCTIASGSISLKNTLQQNAGWVSTSASPAYSFDPHTNVLTIVNQCTSTPGFVLPKYAGASFNKLDKATGRLLPGSKIDGESCTKYDGEPVWTCNSLNDYNWFSEGFTLDGTTRNRFSTEIDMEPGDGWGNPNGSIQHCVALRETTAPAGYTVKSNPAVVCLGTDGWTAVNAIKAGFTSTLRNSIPATGGQFGDWVINNDRAANSQQFILYNEKTGGTTSSVSGHESPMVQVDFVNNRFNSDDPVIPAGQKSVSGNGYTMAWENGKLVLRLQAPAWELKVIKGDAHPGFKQEIVCGANFGKPCGDQLVWTLNYAPTPVATSKVAASSLTAPKTLSVKRNTVVALKSALTQNKRAVVGQRVNLQRQSGKTWKTVASAKTDRKGVASIKVKAVKGTYTYRMQFTSVKGKVNGSTSKAFSVRGR